MGSEFINPIIILPKGNIVKLVIDARYLNSITDLSRYSWPLEPIGSLITKLKEISSPRVIYAQHTIKYLSQKKHNN